MLRWIRRIVVGFFALLGVAVVVLAAAAAWLGSELIEPAPVAIPAAAVLELDLDKPLGQGEIDQPLETFLGREPQLSLREIEEALQRARIDPRVKGLIVRLGARALGLADTQELRDAIAAFRASGKFADAYAESFGAEGGGNDAYYLASACQDIWLQPSGELDLTGVVAETPFLKGTLDKLGVDVEFDKREEYKTAIDQLTDASYSAAFKESMASILGSVYGQLVAGISAGRSMAPDTVAALIDNGPYLAQDALASKLVDQLGYFDQLESDATGRAGAGAKTLSLADFFRATEAAARGPVVAYIDASGAIVSGESDPGDAFGVSDVGAETYVKALDDATKSKDVAAILLRIDSPGGSYLASDSIRRAVARARAAGKPVIVSMGDVAASGGYFIAIPATKIVAEPGTLTGSIGVFGGKFVIRDLLTKLGVTFDSVQFGSNADIWSPVVPFTPAGRAKLEQSLDAVYRDFTGKVAAARGIAPAQIPNVAKGRVFTGEEALKLGLVDALGGLPTALRFAREAAGLAPEAPVRLRRYPREGTGFERFLDRMIAGGTSASIGGIGVDARPGAALGVLAATLGFDLPRLRPLLDELPALASPGESWLLMPPIDIR